jgi:multicomponent Na+:H+ antiporter subunit D
MAGVSPAMLAALMLRPAMTAFRSSHPALIKEAPFPMLLGAALAVFFCLAIGIAPSWLFGLLPTVVAFEPFALDRTAPHLELLGAAGVVYVVLRALRLAPLPRAGGLLDIDAFYRGPAAGAGRWVGVVLLRLYGSWQALLERLATQLGRSAHRWSRNCDRPYRMLAPGAAQLAALAICVAVVMFWRMT